MTALRPTYDIVNDLRLRAVDEYTRGFTALRQFIADAADRLEDQAAEIARLRKHSVILNSVAWRISEALGKVGADDTEVLGDAQADLEELISQLEACTP